MNAIDHDAFAFQGPACRFFDEEKGNLLVAAPTSAGKTSRVAVHWLRQAGRGVFVAPGRDLCDEVHDILCAEFGSENVGIGNADYALDPEMFKRYRYVVVTHFKNQHFLNNLKDYSKWAPVIVIDEIDQFDFAIDKIVTTLLSEFPKTRVLALSGTVAKEDRPKLAKWLNARVIESDLRPVDLVKSVVLVKPLTGLKAGQVELTVHGDGEAAAKIVPAFPKAGGTDLALYQHRLISELDPSGSVMYFSPRQRLANDVLEDLINYEGSRREPDPELSQISARLPRRKGRVNELLKRGLPFGLGLLHSSVSPREKRLVRKLLRQGKLRGAVVCFSGIRGLNLPVRNFIFCCARDPKTGALIDVSDFNQGGGRAGRAGFDVIGRVMIPARTKVELVEIQRVLIAHDASPIISEVENERDLPALVAGLIRRGYRSEARLRAFFQRTYWGTNEAPAAEIKRMVAEAIALLRSFSETDLLDRKRTNLWLTSEGMALARLVLHPDEFQMIMALTNGYADLELPGETADQFEAADNFEVWVECIGETFGKFEGLTDEETQLAIADVKRYGLAVSSVHRASYPAKPLADYLRRMLDRAGAYLQYYDLPSGWRQWWRANIYNRATFGELNIAHALSSCHGVGYDMVRRLIAEGLLTSKSVGEFSPEELEQVASTLYGHIACAPAERSLQQVAAVLGCEKEVWEQIVSEVLSEEKEVV